MNKDMNIEDFIGSYPYITEGDFNRKIIEKNEFNSLRMKEVDIPGKDLLPHQKIIARFLSPYTLYDSLLLFHEVGSGKSCSAIGTVELARSTKLNNTIRGALFLVRGDTIAENLKNELVFKCTDGRYIPENFENLTDLEKHIRIKKKISPFYDFQTFQTFATNIISKNTDDELRRLYNNFYIVIDEAHNLRTDDPANIIYNSFHRFLHILDGCKVILMTGTPMIDKPEEIAKLMNLIIPSTQQFVLDSKFREKYLNSEGMLTKNIDDFVKRINGRVSYVKSMKSNVTRKFIGTNLKGNINLDLCEMSDEQYEAYISAVKKDKRQTNDQIDEKENTREGSALYSNSKQASLFVYPEGNEYYYGRQFFEKYISISEIRSLDSNVVIKDYRMKGALFKGENKMELLKKYSSKYYKVVKSILDHPDELHFVYSELVSGSGLILFSKILEEMNFGRYKGGTPLKSKRKQYSIITNDTTSVYQASNIIKTFNSSKNVNGDYIQVILGSAVISEGVTLKNVKHIHILTPHWNYAPIEQAMARAIRMFSHSDLEGDVTVNIHLYCAVSNSYKYNTPEDTFIDVKMYQTSIRKDLSIKSVEYVIKKSAFDCYLTKDRNTYPSGYNNKRECEYKDCEYECNVKRVNDIDYTTYNLHYTKNEVDDGIKSIQKIFRSHTFIFLTDLSSLIQKSLYVTLECLRQMINSFIQVQDRFGNSCFLKIDNDIVYICKKMENDEGILDTYYVNHPYLENTNTYNDYINEYVVPISISKIMNPVTKTDTRVKIIKTLSKKIQSYLLESSILAKREKQDKSSTVRDDIIEFYKPYWYDRGDYIISTLSPESYDVYRCLRKTDKQWINCPNDIVRKEVKMKNEEKTKLLSNKYGFYLIKKGDKYTIRDVTSSGKVENKDNRSNSRGKACTSYTKDILLSISDKIGLKKDDLPSNKKEMCDIIEGRLKELGLLEEMN
jgi:hypothetical protein